METEPLRLKPEEGQALLNLARHTIGTALGLGVPDLDTRTKEILDRPVLKEKRGTFVTLKKNGSLRGCIGSLAPVESIVQGVQRNAINAAFEDPRFPPLGREEFPQVTIEVSVLTPAVPLAYETPGELLAKIVPGKDGVILRKGLRSATFLPQVWEQLPEPARFFDHLCLKAGLPPDAWRREVLEVETYRVQYFDEEESGR